MTYSLFSTLRLSLGTFTPSAGLLPLRLRCPDFSVLPCFYDIRLDLIPTARVRGSATRRAARIRTEIAAGGKRTVRLRLSRRMRTLVRRRGKAKFRLTVIVRAGATGPRSTLRRNVTLRARP